MANTKKTVETEEKINTTTATSTEEVSKPAAKKIVEKNDNSAQEIEQLKAQIDMLMKMMTLNAQAATVAATPKDERVKIIHLVERAPGLSTYMELSNLVVKLSKFGEERILSLQQFEEMVGKYRSWFDKGLISVAAGYEEVAQRYGLKTAADYPIDSEFIHHLGNANMLDIEEIYPKLPEAGKDFLLSYWNRKVIEGDPNFKDRRKIETLDRLSDGAMSQVIRGLVLEAQQQSTKKN